MDTNKKNLNPYEEYLCNFAKRYNMTIEEASERAIVKARLSEYLETGM